MVIAKRRAAGVVFVAVWATALLCGCAERPCSTDSDCPPGQTCVQSGGVLFQGAACIASFPEPGTSSDAGDTGPDGDVSRDLGDGALDFGRDFQPEPSCDDGITNGTETDVDCGGDCPTCELDARCFEDADCTTGFCDDTCRWPRSCAGWKSADRETPDGRYQIDADGPGPAPVVEVFCDMTSDQGAGYTMVRVEEPALDADATQDDYRAVCEALGMEVVVPRSRGHALAMVEWNDVPPNIVNVFPDSSGSAGLQNWHGECQGEPCRFWLSDTNSAGCRDSQPSGDNTASRALIRRTEASDECPFGGWNDDTSGPLDITGWVICSTNDVGPPTYGSCLDILENDSLQNTEIDGSTGDYVIQPDGANEPVEVMCDMQTDGGGYTYLKLRVPMALSAGQADEMCSEFGMQLFIPRTRAHRNASVDVARSPDVGPTGHSRYMSILAIYADRSGARCHLRPFHSDNPDCEFSAADGGPFFITGRSVFENPNGSIASLSDGHSLEYRWNSDGNLAGIEDYGPPGYTSDRFMCDVGDKQ